MIKINLLGEEIVDTRSDRGVLVAYFGSLALTLIIGVVLYFSYSSRASDLKAELTGLEARLAQLQKVTQEVSGLEKRKAELDDKLSVIARLKLGKEGPVRLFDDLNMAIPEHLWITDLKEDRGSLTITGLALSDTAIVDFVKKLEVSDYFRTAEIVNSTQVYLIQEVNRSGSRGKSATGITETVAHRVEKYDQLSKEQREAFAAERFGAGVKLRSFVVRGAITYIGKEALKMIQDQQALEAAKKKAPDPKASKKQAKPAKAKE